MFEASIAFKAIAGIGVASTGSCGAYYLMKNNNFLNKEEQTSDTKSELISGGDKAYLIPDKYYIAELKTATTSPPTKELYEDNAKNFKCTFTVDNVEKEDPNCDVFKVSQEASSSKLLNLDNFAKSSVNPTKSDLNTVSTKVKIKSSVADQIYWNKLSNITLKAISTTDAGKNYGEFIFKYLISGNNPVGKSNLFIVEFIENKEYPGHKDVSNKCTLDLKSDENIPNDCEIYKLKEQINANKNYKDIEIGEKIEENKIQETLKNKDLYIFNLKDKSFDINISDTKPFIYYWEKTNESSEKVKVSARFKVISSLSSETTFTKDSKPIVLL